MKKKAFVSLTVGACAAAGALIACQQDVVPGIPYEAEVGAVREAIEAKQGDGVYEFRFANGNTISGDCDGITYNAPKSWVQEDGSIVVTWEPTYIYEYFASDARIWEKRLSAVGIKPMIHITHYPHQHCWVMFTSNLLVEPPREVK